MVRLSSVADEKKATDLLLVPGIKSAIEIPILVGIFSMGVGNRTRLPRWKRRSKGKRQTFYCKWYLRE
jgi:hypothetical protein